MKGTGNRLSCDASLSAVWTAGGDFRIRANSVAWGPGYWELWAWQRKEFLLSLSASYLLGDSSPVHFLLLLCQSRGAVVLCLLPSHTPRRFSLSRDKQSSQGVCENCRSALWVCGQGPGKVFSDLVMKLSNEILVSRTPLISPRDTAEQAISLNDWFHTDLPGFIHLVVALPGWIFSQVCPYQCLC